MSAPLLCTCVCLLMFVSSLFACVSFSFVSIPICSYYTVVKYFESYFKTDLSYLLRLVFVSVRLAFVRVLFSCFDLLFLLVLEFMLSSRIYWLPY